MTPQELYNLTIKDLKVSAIHPMHEAILEECCENAINSREGITDKETLLHVVQVAFMTCDSTIKGTIKAGRSQGDIVTINYRNRTFTFKEDSEFIR